MRPILDDKLWEQVAPLLPPEKPKPKGGRPRLSDRAALTGILFVLRSGIPWEMLPKEMGCGSGMTCWRRLKEWQAAGVWQRLHRVFLEKLGRAGEIDWSRTAVDSATVAAKKGAKRLANPTDKGKPGSKHHLLVDWKGVPLTVLLTAANVHDSKVLDDLLDSVPAIPGPRGRPRFRPDKLHADKGYDYSRCRRSCRKRGIRSRIARKGIESKDRLGRHRWVVERTHAWRAKFRRLRIRDERREDIHLAFLNLGCALICWNFVQRFC